MRVEFEERFAQHNNKKEWTNKKGRIEKYQGNLAYGKMIKKNPIIKIFDKVEKKLQSASKMTVFEKIKS